MRIIQTKDYEIIAMLNQHVHKVHSALYPDYFKEYDFVSIRDFFKNIIDNPSLNKLMFSSFFSLFHMFSSLTYEAPEDNT